MSGVLPVFIRLAYVVVAAWTSVDMVADNDDGNRPFALVQNACSTLVVKFGKVAISLVIWPGARPCPRKFTSTPILDVCFGSV